MTALTYVDEGMIFPVTLADGRRVMAVGCEDLSQMVDRIYAARSGLVEHRNRRLRAALAVAASAIMFLVGAIGWLLWGGL